MISARSNLHVHPRGRHPVLAAGLAALAAALWRPGPACCDEPASAPTSQPRPATVRLEWGLYQILWNPTRYEELLRREIAKFASTPDYVMFYRDLGRPYPRAAIEAIRRIGATPIVSLELWQWHGPRGSYLERVNSGAFDAYFRQWARDAKRDGRRVLLRFGFEFNGDWFTWGGDPQGFIRAWRRARRIFRDAGALNVEWVWSPNVVSVPDTPANRMHRYWPGSAWVDWIGLDGYNFGPDHDRWHRWESFAEIFGPALRAVERRWPGKPVIIAEFGCAPGTPAERARWIREAYAAIVRHRQVRAAVWYNYDKRREGEPNWRIDADAASLRAFNETFARPAGGRRQGP